MKLELVLERAGPTFGVHVQSELPEDEELD